MSSAGDIDVHKRTMHDLRLSSYLNAIYLTPSNYRCWLEIVIIPIYFGEVPYLLGVVYGYFNWPVELFRMKMDGSCEFPIHRSILAQ